ncbi:hypothetical protein [Xylanibacter brevis]|uniref:hypothetical protein n=1 Tax=Xylanibacter brevis TaxID=83231 RepID=UPI000AB75D44|nr:hypothetical protein [Xylanibacter brevis]
MKKSLKLLALTILGSWMAGNTWAIEPVGDVYQIGSAQDWAEFAEIVNKDGRQHELNAVLTQDFTLNELVMVGIPSNAYKGTFDGQGHTITINFTMDKTGQDGECGLFRRINGATIKNLKVAGTITTSGQLAGGVVSGIWQTAVVENCVSTVTITDTNSGDATHGGIVARISDKSDITIRNCAFFGTIDAPNRSGSGGIIGWPDNGGASVKIQNCLMAGTLNLATGSDNDIIVRNSATITNCYYVNLQGMNNSKNATLATAEQLASGELCYLLNGLQSASVNWYQTIGTDNAPMPICKDGAVVYANGELKCDGITPKEGSTLTFSNVEGNTIDSHNYVDGICSVCRDLKSVGGIYQIGCGDALVRFAEIVNSGYGSSNAVLTKNIDMDGESWTPIGQDGKDFAGHFNGQNYRIQNLVVNNPTINNQALFGQVVGTAIIENVIMDASCSIKGKQHVAGILGHVWGHGAIIRNCVNEASVESSESQASGIVATAEKKVFIQNCINKGEIKSNESSAAGILARAWNDSQESEVTNCVNEGHIIGIVNEVGGIVGALNKAITISGCLNKGEINGKDYTGGVLGRIWENNVVVQNCGNEGTVISTGANAAGIVGCSGNIVSILNCYNLGDITGSKESAAICGWMGNGSSQLRNCYSKGSVTGLDGNNYLIRKTDIVKSNNYQLEGMAGDQGTPFSASDLTSGKLAYMMNGNKSTDVVWFQKLGTDADAYPIPWGANIVYKNGDLYCDGTSKGSDSYSNVEGSNRDDHHFNEGFCDNLNGSSVVCEELDPSYMTLSDGYYQVSTARQLRWTAAISQNSTNAAMKVRIMTNIDMTGEKFGGFGSNESEANRFSGEIDGQRHIISNLKMDYNRNGVGFVNTATVGANLQNLTMAKSCEFKGESAVAAFIGAVRGTAGNLYIRNCGNESAVSSTGANAAGFIGCKYDDDVIPNLKNCYNVGVIHSSNGGGSFSGWMPKAKLTNCYSIVSQDEKDNNNVSYGFENGQQFSRGWSQELTNCYDFGTGDWGTNNGSWGSAFTGDHKIMEVNETTMGVVFAGLYDAVDGNVWRMEYEGWAHPVLYDPAKKVLSENVPNRFSSENGVDLTLKRTTVADTWNTICLPFALNATQIASLFGADAKVAELTGAIGETLNFTTVTTIEAGKAYLVKPTVAMTEEELTVDLDATAPAATTEGGYEFTGIYQPTAVVANDLFVAAGNKLTPSDGTGKLKAFRAYFHNTGSGARLTNFVIDEETTGIASIEDGLMKVQDAVYDMQGRKVSQLKKGLYIVNGKKQVVR